MKNTNPTQTINTNNKDRISDQNDGRYADKTKKADKDQENNKTNPDDKKIKDGDTCGC